MTYTDAVFYVMSGTGNTYQVARRMQEAVVQQGGAAQVTMIEDAGPASELGRSSSCLVGLLFPTHGFMPPWSMIKFLLKMPRRRGVPAICVATRGAGMIGSVLIPGAAGLATFMAALILFSKGYRIKAIFSLDMPANMTNLFWGLHPKNVAVITEKANHRLSMIMPEILKGGRIWFTRNNLWDALWGFPLLWFIPIFPIIYLIMGRIFMGKLMFSNNQCLGCGLCARSCAAKAIVMKGLGKKKKRPFWTYHCENCMRCMGYCPRQAVEAGHSWAVLLGYITAVPVITYLLVWLRGYFPAIPVIKGYWPKELINLIYVYPALFFSYWIFWQLIRIPVINNLFTYTTLTHFYRRFHHPEIKRTHMTGGGKSGKQPPEDV